MSVAELSAQSAAVHVHSDGTVDGEVRNMAGEDDWVKFLISSCALFLSLSLRQQQEAQ